MIKQIIYITISVLLLFGCNNSRNGTGLDSLNLEWTPLDSLNSHLPEGITVFQTIHVGANLRAWYVKVEEPRPNIETRVVVSTDVDRRETISDFATRLQAAVLINGGYFRMDLNPAKHVGILKVNDELIHGATTSVIRNEKRYYIHRAAIGFDVNDQASIEWVSTSGDSVFRWEHPIYNLPGSPGEQLDPKLRTHWTYRDILGGGPQLIRDGKIDIPINEELFFGTSIPSVHPRTAAGITAAGDLILLLVDGRQLISRGVDLEELAKILYDLGCQTAINLDGGGSSALVVNGILLNRPAGKTTQREVMSALAVFAR